VPLGLPVVSGLMLCSFEQIPPLTSSPRNIRNRTGPWPRSE
jgi:hypothetical protein